MTSKIMSLLGVLMIYTIACSSVKADAKGNTNQNSDSQAGPVMWVSGRRIAGLEYLYVKEIKDRYCFDNGMVKTLQRVGGEIIQVINDKIILLSQEEAVYRSGTMSASEFSSAMNSPNYVHGQPVSVSITNTKGMHDGQSVTLIVCDDGTFKYEAVSGATKTVKAFKVVPPITFDEFKKLRESGYKFPGDMP